MRKYPTILFVMSKIMEMSKEEQNQVTMYLYNNIEISDISVLEHFTDVSKTIKMPKGEEKEYTMLTEDEKRFYQRNWTRKGNYSLNQAAKNAGVKNFDKFHNSSYKGLYNGETADDIAKRKGLRYREDILDNIGSDELIANLFRISQTEQRLKRDNVDTEKKACDTHNKIGKIVRNAIKQAGGIMPENLPTPKKSLEQLEKEKIKVWKKVDKLTFYVNCGIIYYRTTFWLA